MLSLIGYWWFEIFFHALCLDISDMEIHKRDIFLQKKIIGIITMWISVITILIKQFFQVCNGTHSDFTDFFCKLFPFRRKPFNYNYKSESFALSEEFSVDTHGHVVTVFTFIFSVKLICILSYSGTNSLK